MELETTPLADNEVMTAAGVLAACECGAMPWYLFGDVSYVGCSTCGRRTTEYLTPAAARNAWNAGLYADGD